MKGILCHHNETLDQIYIVEVESILTYDCNWTNTNVTSNSFISVAHDLYLA